MGYHYIIIITFKNIIIFFLSFIFLNIKIQACCILLLHFFLLAFLWYVFSHYFFFSGSGNFTMVYLNVCWTSVFFSLGTNLFILLLAVYFSLFKKNSFYYISDYLFFLASILSFLLESLTWRFYISSCSFPATT